MLPNPFIGKAKAPTGGELAKELGPGQALWDDLLDQLARDQGIVTREWHSYSKKAGWALRLKLGERTILYLSPYRNGFRASFALGANALEAARQSGVPGELLDAAPRYAETGVRIDVKGPGDAAVVRKLAAAKVAH